MRDQILEHLRQATKPRSAKEVAEDLDLRVDTIETILEDLKCDGKVAQLNSGRWEVSMPMPTGPRDNRGQGRRKQPRTR